ncbi:sex hormone-binding globulin precursor [Silurus asotus]|uniref:Sex hormone-binding globulin n=1 Tax=Silurus asotus TaxID=30991 RepID=A0AAD5AI80_SILAS|nr:sex hormone-binding globulin precursor [Silurus asotus]
MDFLRNASIFLALFLNLNWFWVSAVKVSGNEVINLGHKSSAWEPLMHISANLSTISSITSHFEFRTFDPEGIVFYGDTKEGQDWFVLSLRDGIPEVQIGKANMLVSVKGGPKLNDGAWHKLELRSEGKYVVVEINNQAKLELGMKSDQTDEVLTGKIRLALGGMLVDQKKLLHPFNPWIDACIRKGNWLNLSTPWDAEPSWKPSPCFPEIKTGSYFPGSGLALFNTSDLPGVKTEESGVTIEVYGSWHGTLMSVQSNEFQFTFPGVKKKVRRSLSVDLKEESGSSNTDDSTKLTLTFLKHTLMLNGKQELVDESIDFLSRWTDGMILAFGGVPGETENHLQGCLEKILIQGQAVDLDHAFSKHSSISSHSCPVNTVNELTES